MKDTEFDSVRCSGNVCRDLCGTDADVTQIKDILAAAITNSVDKEGMTVRRAHTETATGGSLRPDRHGPVAGSP